MSGTWRGNAESLERIVGELREIAGDLEELNGAGPAFAEDIRRDADVMERRAAALGRIADHRAGRSP